MRLRSRETRRRLGWVAATLDNVSLIDFAPNDVPEVTFDRLNAHYRDVVDAVTQLDPAAGRPSRWSAATCARTAS